MVIEYGLGADMETFELDLLAIVRQCEQTYFSGIKPISSADFDPCLDGPSRFLPELNRIEVKACFALFQKLCRLLVLHELIHKKLYGKFGKVQSDSGNEFLAEVKLLWDCGAYRGLL